MRGKIGSLLLVGVLAFSLSACGASQTGLGAQELEGNIAQGGQPDAQETVTPLADATTSTPAGAPRPDEESALGPFPALEGEPPNQLPLAQLNTLSQLESYRKQSVVRYAPQGQPEQMLYAITEAANQVSPLDFDLDTLEHTTVAFLEGGQRTERTQFVWIGEGRYWADLEGTWQQVDLGPAEYVQQSAFGEQMGDELDLAFLFADNMWPFPDQASTEFDGVEQVNGMTLWRYAADADQLGGGMQGFTGGQVTAWVEPEGAVVRRVEADLTNPDSDGVPLTLFFVMDLAQVNQAPDMVPDMLFEPEPRLPFQVDSDGTITIPELGTISSAGADVPVSLNPEDLRPLTVLETYQRHTVVSLAPQGADGPVRRVEILTASAVNGSEGAIDTADEAEFGGDVLRAADMYFVEDNQVVGLAQFLGVNDDFWVQDANGWADAGLTPAEYLDELNFFGDWDDALDANWLFDEDIWFLSNIRADDTPDDGAETGLVGVETIDEQEFWRYEYGMNQVLAGFGGFDPFEDGRLVAWVHPTYQVMTRMFVVAIDENPVTTDFGQADGLGDAAEGQNEDGPQPEQEGLEAIQGVLGSDDIPDGVPVGAAVLTIETQITGINEPVTITAPDEIMDTPLGMLDR